MRPAILLPLFAPIISLPGIGKQMERKYQKLIGGDQVIDLLLTTPRTIARRVKVDKIQHLHAGMLATLHGQVGEHRPPQNQSPYQGRGRTKAPYRIAFHDEEGDLLILVFFHGDTAYLRRQYPEGTQLAISGRIEQYGDLYQMPHPDYSFPIQDAERIPQFEPIYPLTAGISNRQMMKIAKVAFSQHRITLPEWLDKRWVTEPQSWPSFFDALLQLHQPDAFEQQLFEHEFEENQFNILAGKAGLRLAYDELLANQLGLLLVRQRLGRERGRVLKGADAQENSLTSMLIKALPYQLTASQQQVLKEIYGDMAKPERMLRLLQGDVGSGKTIVALLAMLRAIESAPCQAALLAPTEILARQHYESISPLATALGLETVLLIGRGRGGGQKQRKITLEAIKTGKAKLIIGTHALFQAEVHYQDLALVVIDEQHRFGVHQRLSLSGKGNAADMLVMTATPIPRTLMLSYYGDLDHSRLTEKPPGRKPITTVVIPAHRIEQVVERICQRLVAGDQIYWICPLIEENESLRLIAAEQRLAALQQAIAEKLSPEWQARIAMVHGRMKSAEKEKIMQAFYDGDLRLLVATTVVEVGVDVPNACIMVIEHAEHFGLSQLHQLRGRVGRGEKPSSCVLIRADHIGDTAFQRLKIIADSEDGLLIAEKDLELRGAGEVLGARQSGLPEFRFADIGVHKDLMALAHHEAEKFLNNDPQFKSERGQALRNLLYLFRYDEAMNYIESG